MNKNKEFLSAVVYIHNNAELIEKFIYTIDQVLKNNFEHYEIIFVDDFSNDNSNEVIKKCCKKIKDTTVSVIKMSYYQGLEFSMNAGVDLAIGDFILEFDSVLINYEETLIMDVYNKCLEGNDIVCTSPKEKKKLSSKIFYKIFNRYSNRYSKLNTETFRLLSRRAINRVNQLNRSIPYRKAIYASCGLKMETIFYVPTNNTKIFMTKEQKLLRRDVAFDSIVLFTDFASRFTIALAVIMMLFVLSTFIYTIVIFISKQPIAGWTTTMLLLSIAFFGIFSILAIIIKYLSIVLNLVFKKQNYLVESINKIK